MDPMPFLSSSPPSRILRRLCWSLSVASLCLVAVRSDAAKCPTHVPPFVGFVTQRMIPQNAGHGGDGVGDNRFDTTYAWTISPTSPTRSAPVGINTASVCPSSGLVSQYEPFGACKSVATSTFETPHVDGESCVFSFISDQSLVDGLGALASTSTTSNNQMNNNNKKINTSSEDPKLHDQHNKHISSSSLSSSLSSYPSRFNPKNNRLGAHIEAREGGTAAELISVSPPPLAAAHRYSGGNSTPWPTMISTVRLSCDPSATSLVINPIARAYRSYERVNTVFITFTGSYQGVCDQPPPPPPQEVQCPTNIAMVTAYNVQMRHVGEGRIVPTDWVISPTSLSQIPVKKNGKYGKPCYRPAYMSAYRIDLDDHCSMIGSVVAKPPRVVMNSCEYAFDDGSFWGTTLTLTCDESAAPLMEIDNTGIVRRENSSDVRHTYGAHLTGRYAGVCKPRGRAVPIEGKAQCPSSIPRFFKGPILELYPSSSLFPSDLVEFTISPTELTHETPSSGLIGCNGSSFISRYNLFTKKCDRAFPLQNKAPRVVGNACVYSFTDEKRAYGAEVWLVCNPAATTLQIDPHVTIPGTVDEESGLFPRNFTGSFAGVCLYAN